MDTQNGYQLAQVGNGKVWHYSTGNDETTCGRTVARYLSFGEASGMAGGICSRCSRYADTHGAYQGYDTANGRRFLSITNPRPEPEEVPEDLTGHYEPNMPGARTLRDARPLYVNGDRVTVSIDGDQLYLYVGGTWLYDGPVPAEIKTRADVNPWAARVALGDPAPWARVGARISVPLAHATVTRRALGADGRYMVEFQADGYDFGAAIAADSPSLGRLCVLCDTIGDDDNDPEYPARFSRFGKYLCGFCSHAYSGRYVARTMPGRPEDGWAIFDRELIDWTTIRMTEGEATSRAEELNGTQDARASLSGLPLPVVTVAEVLELLAPVPYVQGPTSVYVTTEGGKRIEYAHIPSGDPDRVAHFLEAARAVPAFEDASTTR